MANEKLINANRRSPQCVSLSHWGLFAVELTGKTETMMIQGLDHHDKSKIEKIEYYSTRYRPFRYDEEINHGPRKISEINYGQ